MWLLVAFLVLLALIALTYRPSKTNKRPMVNVQGFGRAPIKHLTSEDLSEVAAVVPSAYTQAVHGAPGLLEGVSATIPGLNATQTNVVASVGRKAGAGYRLSTEEMEVLKIWLPGTYNQQLAKWTPEVLGPAFVRPTPPTSLPAAPDVVRVEEVQTFALHTLAPDPPAPKPTEMTMEEIFHKYGVWIS